MNRSTRHNVLFISISQFGMAFSFNFLMVFLPFFIHQVSPYSPRETLIWVGLIMGSTSFVAAVASTFWGSMASRYNPKMLYMKGLLSHAILIFLMGFVSSLPLLLGIRVAQGILGGISTLGLIMVSSSSSRQTATKNIGFFQNSLTMGQLLGPPVGAFAASLMGYEGAFIGASTLVFVTLGFCFFFVSDVPGGPGKGRAAGTHPLNREIVTAVLLCFTVTVQLMFLPSILPNVFEGFGIEYDVALKWSGLVVMFYTTTAVVGTHLLCKLASKTGRVRLILALGTLGVIIQSLFAACPGIMSFVAARLVQTFLIAGILPLTISLFAAGLDGKVIGFLNAGRFAGNAMGPIIGTSVLAFSNLTWVYLFISGLGILSLTGFALTFRDRDERGEPPE